MPESRRISSFNQSSTPVPQDDNERPASSEEKKGIWSSLLDGVSSGKRLPEKSVLILGEKVANCALTAPTKQIRGNIKHSARFPRDSIDRFRK